MRIDRVLVNLARLKALYPLKPSAHPFADGVERLSGNLIVELFDSDEPLPAIAATVPVAFGCIIGRDDVGAPAFRALKFDVGALSHGATPAFTGDSAGTT